MAVHRPLPLAHSWVLWSIHGDNSTARGDQALLVQEHEGLTLADLVLWTSRPGVHGAAPGWIRVASRARDPERGARVMSAC